MASAVRLIGIVLDGIIMHLNSSPFPLRGLPKVYLGEHGVHGIFG